MEIGFIIVLWFVVNIMVKGTSKIVVTKIMRFWEKAIPVFTVFQLFS